MHRITHSLAAVILLGAPAVASQESPQVQDGAVAPQDFGTMHTFLTDFAEHAGLNITFNDPTAKALEGTKAKLKVSEDITGPEAGDLLLDVLTLHGFEGVFLGPPTARICKVSMPVPKDAGLQIVLTTQLVESGLPAEIEWEGVESPVAADGGCCDLFPAPTGALEMRFEEKSASANLMTLMEAYAELTDQNILISMETRMLAEGCDPGVRGDISIPAGEVQSVFESILVANDFLMTVVRTEEPRLITFESLRTGARNTVKSGARFVSSADAQHCADHPAMIFTTIVNMPSVDVRQLSNSLRTTLTDANTQQMLPVGNTNQMLLTGLGNQITELVRMLEQVEQASKPRIDLSAPATERHASAAPQAPVPTHCNLFPEATGSLKIAAKDGEAPRLAEIVDQYAALTGQGITTSPETRQLLEASIVDVQSVDVPKGEVQSYFEHLLRTKDYMINVLRDREPRLISIISLRSSDRNTARSLAISVDAEHIAHFKEHPALLVETTVHMPNTDVRQLSNSMRSMLTDANTQMLVPAGNSNSMVLTGFGDGTAELVRVLNKIDSEAGAAQKKELQVVVLEHTQASEVRSTLQELIAPNVSQPGMRGPQGNVSSTTRITVDTRTNSLLIQARAQDMASIKEMIARLDVPTKQDVDGRNGSDE